MAYYDLVWYCNAGDQSTTGHYAVTKRPQNTAVAAGVLRRQFTAPAVGSERVFVCVVAGTTANTTDATWVLTRGALTTDGTATWQEVTGMAAVNGDAVNTLTWAAARAINSSPSLGAIIKRANGASYWVCTTAGSMGASEPSWPNDTAGTTQADGTTTWTCLGVVGNFTGGQAPHARLNNIFQTNWFVAGNTVYVGDNHAESQSAPNLALTVAGSFTIFSRILCHNHSGSYPPAAGDLTTGATISATSFATIALNLTSGGCFYFYGITFKAGSGSSGSTVYFTCAALWTYFDRCSFQLPSTGSGNTIQFGNNSSSAQGVFVLNNCTVYFGNTGDSINILLSQFTWQNTGQVLASGSSVPVNFLYASSGSGGQQDNMVLEALDLSQLTGNLFNSAQQNLINLLIKDCKLNATSAIPALTNNSGGSVQLVRCDSGATGYKSARYTYEGVETTETSITRVGGASDPTGQAQSRKIVTTANINWLRPFKAEPYAIWNPTTGANVTVTVYGTINAGALPNNDDIWIEIEYLGSSTFPLGTMVNTTKASVLAANAAVASDSSTWSVSAYSSWNAADLASVVLSNNALTATSTAINGAGVRAINGYGSGKFYFEMTVTTWVSSSTGIGLALATAALNVGSSAGQIVVQAGSGTVLVGGGNSGFNIGARSSGNTIGIAIDLTAQLVWFRVAPSGNWNGNATHNPSTGAGGVSISSVSGVLYPVFLPWVVSDSVTANFGGSAFSGVVPTGFVSGWPSNWTPFKLTTTLSSPQPGMAGYLHARVRAAKASTTWYIDPKIILT